MKKCRILLCLLLLCLVCSGCEGSYGYYGRADIPPMVEQWREQVEFYADMYEVSEYVDLLLAIIAQESGGNADKVPDIMQCSASAGKTITDPIASIRQGTYYFSTLLASGTDKGVDLDTVIQSYNFGGGYQNYIAEEQQGHHSEYAARAFSARMCEQHGYSFYGDVLYVEHVRSYLSSLDGGLEEGDYESMQECMREYMGVPYLYGGNGKYGIDCSALTQRIYKRVGITLPRTAQGQYDAVIHIADYEAEPGDLVFFQGTYESGSYITHVGVYVGDGRMFHASAGQGYCCYTSIYTVYYQSHFGGFGRP